VRDVKVVDDRDGKIVVPLTINGELTNFKPKEHGQIEITLDKASLRINQEIDDSVFDIPLSQAESYHDDVNQKFYRNGVLVRTGPGIPASGTSTESDWVYICAILALAMTVVGTISYLRLRIARKDATSSKPGMQPGRGR
jgi:hypothetical protein